MERRVVITPLAGAPFSVSTTLAKSSGKVPAEIGVFATAKGAVGRRYGLDALARAPPEKPPSQL